MKNYETARKLFSILEFAAWSMVALGILAAFALTNAISSHAPMEAGFIAALPGLAISFFGILSAGMVQNWRAGVDSAEYGQQMLKIARDQLEVSRQSLNQRHRDVPSFSTKVEAKDETAKSSPSFSDLPVAKDESDLSGAEQIKDQSNDAERVEREDFGYRDQSISALSDAYVFDGTDFDTKEEVMVYIDNLETGKANQGE